MWKKEKPVEARENERIRMEKTVGHECVNENGQKNQRMTDGSWMDQTSDMAGPCLLRSWKPEPRILTDALQCWDGRSDGVPWDETTEGDLLSTARSSHCQSYSLAHQ
jgi:hypothetical protein